MSGCPHCNTQIDQIKAGLLNGKQRFQCLHCRRKYTLYAKGRGYPESYRKRAATLRAQGKTINQIAATLSVHPRSVANWLNGPEATRPVVSHEIAQKGQTGYPRSEKPGSKKNKRPTLSDVARLANVSVMSVSNCINSTGRLSAITEARIRLAIEDLGYVPNATSRTLRGRRSGNIGFGCYGLSDASRNISCAVTPHLIAGIYDAASAARMNVLMFTGWDDIEGNLPYEQFLDGQIDGLIWVDPGLTEGGLERLSENGLPVVCLLTRHVPDGIGFVNADNVEGISRVVKHLYATGHRRIAFAGRTDKSNYNDRWIGYREGLAQVGLRFDPRLEVTGSSGFSTTQAHIAAVEDWLRLPDPPTAIVLPDDRSAIAVVNHLIARGIKLPEEMSVTGFDDLPFAETDVAHGLTTVRQDFFEMARRAFNLLCRMIDSEPAERCRDVFLGDLIVRGSTVSRLAVKAPY